jgi:uncharacterized protein YeaO (DUF488 family)
MIYTGYYAKLKDYIEAGLTPIAISGGIPEFYPKDYLWWKFLAPSWDIFSKWKNGEINDFIYMERYVPEILGKINKHDFKQKLLSVENPILLCFEKEGFCHRHIVADWIENELGIPVAEFKIQ